MALLLLATPALAHANVGTPLMWATALHLYLANFAIGIGEAVVIAKYCRAPMRPLISSMILANYISAISGWFAMRALNEALAPLLMPHDPIFGLWALFIMLGGLSFLFTLVLEAPFAWLGLRKSEAPQRRKVMGFILSQSMSYAALALLYLVSSDLTFIRAFSGERTRDKITGVQGWVYYINDVTGEILRTRLAGGEPEKVGATPRIAFSESSLLEALPGNPPMLGIGGRGGLQDPPTTPTSIELPRTAADRPPIAFSFNITAEPHAWGSLWISRSDITADDVLYRVETPFASYRFRGVTPISPNVVILQMDRWILILDLESRRAATVCQGYGPLVVLD